MVLWLLRVLVVLLVVMFLVAMLNFNKVLFFNLLILISHLFGDHVLDMRLDHALDFAISK